MSKDGNVGKTSCPRASTSATQEHGRFVSSELLTVSLYRQSLPIVERFVPTLKQEDTRRIVIPPEQSLFRQALALTKLEDDLSKYLRLA